MSDTLKGIVWMLGTIVSFSLMAVAGRELTGILDTFEIMMYRSIVGIIAMVAVITVMKKWPEVRTHNIGTHFLRNFTHFTGQNLWFFAVTAIPLAQVFALEFTTPLWVLLLSPLLLGERLTLVRLGCALLGFFGILLVTRPDTMTELNLGVATAASCAIFFALTIIMTKRLTRTDTVACILFYLTTIQLIFGVITAGWDGDIAVPSGVPLIWAVVIGFAGLMAHFCYTNALRLAPASVVTPMDFARLPTIAVVAYLAYAEVIDPMVFVGGLLIFAGNYLNIWTEMRRKPTAG
ncbi:MAG: DMT family transporter [Aliishimia sp.]